jgi:hypothetical protein
LLQAVSYVGVTLRFVNDLHGVKLSRAGDLSRNSERLIRREKGSRLFDMAADQDQVL